MKLRDLFTSESVSEGHPDKLCDQISDAILDAVLALDPEAHVACETFATKDYVLISGEITAKEHPDYVKIARDVIRNVGYTAPELGIGADTCTIETRINRQSPDIAKAVGHINDDQGAGDQGIMFGYASNENEGYMPLAIVIAHKLVRYASQLRKEGKFVGARPDMKSQVTIDYSDAKNPRIDNILMSIQHEPTLSIEDLRNYTYQNVILPVVKSFGLNQDFNVLVNPGGAFILGGPAADTGLTGRKIIVDTYGGYARHGGGAFSGKDPSKVDRSAAYMARYIAKNLVAAGVAERIEIQLGYAIGVARPLSLAISTFKTGHYDDSVILEIINEIFDCRPGVIIRNFKLNRPEFKYQDIASYGHFGRQDLHLPWEQLDKVEDIKKLLTKYSKK